MQKSTNMTWEEKQKMLDQESRENMRQWEQQEAARKLSRLPADLRKLHDEFKHDPTRCRCFQIAGVE